MISVYRADQLKRFATFSYLKHSFILSLNVKVCIRFTAFLQISLTFLFLKSYVGWEICALASHLHVFCFQLEGGVKSLRTGGGGLKNLGLGGYYFGGGGGIFVVGASTPIICHGTERKRCFHCFHCSHWSKKGAKDS